MKDLNLAIIIGNLGRDPDIKHFPDGGKLANLAIATNRFYKDKDDQWQTVTDWHNVTVRGPSIERVEKLRKGNRVMVQGTIQTRTWQDKEGNKRYSTEIIVVSPGSFVADQTPMRQDNTADAHEEAHTPAAATAPRPTSGSSAGQPWEDDIPF